MNDVHSFRDHPVEDDLKLLKWSDEHCDGTAHVARPLFPVQLRALRAQAVI